MPRQDIIVVGASAGGLEAMKAFAASLPADLPAAVFVVIHIGTGHNGQSYIPEILTAAGPLRAMSARDGDSIRQGTVYVAPPDRHLLVKSEGIRLSHGPKENRSRPAIDPLFRSAALAYGGRVTGMVLTGMLDDGVAGLAEIKRRGGVTVVQDPETALFPSMPLAAVLRVQCDFIVPLSDIAATVSRLANTERAFIGKEEPMAKPLHSLLVPSAAGLWLKSGRGKLSNSVVASAIAILRWPCTRNITRRWSGRYGPRLLRWKKQLT